MRRLAPVIAIVAGCSSSSGAPQPSAASDASAPGDGGGEGGIVAVDQDPTVYPARHHPLAMAKDLGGRTLYAPKIVTVTLAGDAWRDDLRAFDDALVTGAWWTALGRPYAIGAGTSGGYVELPDTVSGKTIDNTVDLRPLLQAKVADGTLPAPDAQTVYVVYVPAATTVTFGADASCSSGMKGFHDWTTARAPGVSTESVDVPYAVLARCSSTKDDLTYAASHEILEAATDPIPIGDKSGWYILDDNAFTGPGGAEIADICAFKGPVLVNGVALAHAWSNDAAAASHDPCQPSDPSEIFFAAAVDTETVTVHDSAGTHASDGYLTVSRGGSTQALVVVFSEAPLSGDLTLAAGYPSGAGDPAILSPIGAGIDATLSKTTARNGTELVLTIRAAESTAPRDYGFVVRAVRSPTDYHSWPVLLRVQ